MRHQCGVLLDVAGSGHCSADGVVDDVGRVVGEHVSGVGRCTWVAPGIAAASSWECAGGVSTSAPPLTMTVCARMEPSVLYWS